jgi:NAD(P)-dependent dehydrogenase (short-subunit alcohol dehydrogenase family)
LNALRRKVAIVRGAASGIGLATAKRFAMEAARVTAVLPGAVDTPMLGKIPM